jgi:hypothetical protein
MTFSNPVVGGTTLVRPAVRSPNYIAGSQGWSVNQDGSAEFNDLTLRGTFVGTDWIQNDNGLFFYSGTPGAGNLVGSWAQADGTDAFGNTYLAGITVTGPNGTVQMSPDDGALTLTSPDGVQMFLEDGAIAFAWPGHASNASVNLDAVHGGLTISSGTLGPNDKTPQVKVKPSSGVPVTGQTDTFPRSSTTSQDGTFVAHHYVSGSVVKCSTDGTTAEKLQTPAYGTNWTDSSTFNGSTGYAPLRFRRDAEDNVVIAGAFKAGSTAPANPVFTLPVGFRPQAGVYPVVVQRNNGGTLSMGTAYVNTNGNFDLFASAGMGIAAGNEYTVTGFFPLGNNA